MHIKFKNFTPNTPNGKICQALFSPFSKKNFLNTGSKLKNCSRAAAREHPVELPVDDLLRLFGRERGAELGAETVDLALFLEVDHRGVAVVVADADLLAQVHAVDLLAQGLVVGVVKVERADEIPAVHGVRVDLGHGAQALPDREQVEICDLVLPLVPVPDVHAVIPPFDEIQHLIISDAPLFCKKKSLRRGETDCASVLDGAAGKGYNWK